MTDTKQRKNPFKKRRLRRYNISPTLTNVHGIDVNLVEYRTRMIRDRRIGTHDINGCSFILYPMFYSIVCVESLTHKTGEHFTAWKVTGGWQINDRPHIYPTLLRAVRAGLERTT